MTKPTLDTSDELVKILEKYAFIDDGGLGEDKFKGNYDFTGTLLALIKWREKAVVEADAIARKDEMLRIIMAGGPIKTELIEYAENRIKALKSQSQQEGLE